MSETQDPEELFPPKPGGMVDTVRQRRAAEQDQAGALAAAVPEPPGMAAVPVREGGTELARARTFSVSTANGVTVTELLGRDDQRRAATIMTLDEPVIISFSLQAADDPRNTANAAGLSANGFALPVLVPFPVPYRGAVYCTATSDTPTRVSVSAFSWTEA